MNYDNNMNNLFHIYIIDQVKEILMIERHYKIRKIKINFPQQAITNLNHFINLINRCK